MKAELVTMIEGRENYFPCFSEAIDREEIDYIPEEWRWEDVDDSWTEDYFAGENTRYTYRVWYEIWSDGEELDESGSFYIGEDE